MRVFVGEWGVCARGSVALCLTLARGGGDQVRDEGDWWAAVPHNEWPASPEQQKIILADFDAPPSPWGDRRQEIVFIGAGARPTSRWSG